MEIYFGYEKKQVIQALRFHFISRPEVKILLVVVNIFAIISAALFFFKKVSPLAFLVASLLWMVLMISFWFILPTTVYKRATTFTETFKMTFSDQYVLLETAKGHMQWSWKNFFPVDGKSEFFPPLFR